MTIDHDRARQLHAEQRHRDEVVEYLKKFPMASVSIKVPEGTFDIRGPGAAKPVMDHQLRELLDNPPDTALVRAGYTFTTRNAADWIDAVVAAHKAADTQTCHQCVGSGVVRGWEDEAIDCGRCDGTGVLATHKAGTE